MFINRREAVRLYIIRRSIALFHFGVYRAGRSIPICSVSYAWRRNVKCQLHGKTAHIYQAFLLKNSFLFARWVLWTSDFRCRSGIRRTTKYIAAPKELIEFTSHFVYTKFGTLVQEIQVWIHSTFEPLASYLCKIWPALGKQSAYIFLWPLVSLFTTIFLLMRSSRIRTRTHHKI